MQKRSGIGVGIVRILAGLFLTLVGFVWLAVADMGPTPRQVFGSVEVARLAGIAVFLGGIFHMLPRFWTWGEEIGTLKAAGRAAWALAALLSGGVGLGLVILAAVLMQDHGVLMAMLEVAVGGAFAVGGADQLRAAWISREQQLGRRPGADDTDESNMILRQARAHGGRVTAAEIAASSSMHYRRAGELLEQLAEDGLCEAKVGSSGGVFYHFPEFEDAELKRDIIEEDRAGDFFEGGAKRQGAGARATRSVEQADQQLRENLDVVLDHDSSPPEQERQPRESPSLAKAEWSK